MGRFEDYARRNALLSDSAERAVKALFDRIADEYGADAAESLLDSAEFREISRAYGNAAAANAARYYSAERLAAGIDDGFEVMLEVSTHEAAASAGYAASDAFKGASRRDFTAAAIASSVHRSARATIAGNSKRDRRCRGYVSLPQGNSTCAFCIMKAAGSYSNYNGSKLETGVSADAWHNNCKCELRPYFADLPKDVTDQMRGYYDMYRAGYDQAMEDTGGKPSGKEWIAAVQSGMRKANGLEH